MHVVRTSAAHLVIGLLLVSLAPHSLAAQTSADEPRTLIEGVYALQEWHKDGQILRPPQVDGRFVLLHGSVVWLMHNRTQEINQTTNASFGSYALDAARFSYWYDDPSTFVRTASGITVSHDPPWPGVRTFDVKREGDAVRLRSPDHQQEFLFTKEGLTLSDGGKVLRVWRRMNQQ